MGGRSQRHLEGERGAGRSAASATGWVAGQAELRAGAKWGRWEAERSWRSLRSEFAESAECADEGGVA